MKRINSIKEKLQYFIENNEVVYQFCGELMEVSNDSEKKNKEKLLNYYRFADRVDVYDKHDGFVADNWAELSDWSTDDDILFLLDGVGALICIPKKIAIANNLIVA